MSDEPIYTAGSELTLTLPLVDETGAQIDAASYTFSLYEEDGNEVETGSGTLNAGAFDCELTLGASSNQLTVGSRMGARQLVLNVVDDNGNTHVISEIYILRASFVPLAVPAESGQTLLQANLLNRGMASGVLESWSYSDQGEQEAALMEAWNRLSRIAYNPWRDVEEPDSDLSELVRYSDFVLNEVSTDDWALLPENFKAALRRAQLIEAAVLLGGDPTWDRMQEGLISKTVGESSEMFRSKPITNRSISPKARREIEGYIRQNISIGRS